MATRRTTTGRSLFFNLLGPSVGGPDCKGYGVRITNARNIDLFHNTFANIADRAALNEHRRARLRRRSGHWLPGERRLIQAQCRSTSGGRWSGKCLRPNHSAPSATPPAPSSP
jgi:hypothetical protein